MPDVPPTVVHAFAAVVADRADQPLITFYDDATGERTELSGATLTNWVAKTANLLVDGLGLAPGDRATAWLPPHWQTAAVLLGAWTAGLTVAYAEPTAAGADVEFASLEAVEAGAPARPAPPPPRAPAAAGGGRPPAPPPGGRVGPPPRRRRGGGG